MRANEAILRYHITVLQQPSRARGMVRKKEWHQNWNYWGARGVSSTGVLDGESLQSAFAEKAT